MGASGHAVRKSRGSAPRKVWVAASGSPSSTRSTAPGPTTTSRRRCAAGVSSCASSTTTRRSRERSRSRAPGSACSVSAAAPRIHAGSKAPGAERAVTSSYSRRTWAAATHSSRPCSRPRRSRSSGSRPSSTARMRRSRSSPRKVRVGTRQGERLGPRRARRGSRCVPGEQLAEDDVLLGTAQQPWRRVPGQRRGLARTPNPSDWWVRASGVVVVPPRRDVTASRRRPAARRVGARRRHASGSASPLESGRPPPRRPPSWCRFRDPRAPAGPAHGGRRRPAGSRRAPTRGPPSEGAGGGRARDDSTTRHRHPVVGHAGCVGAARGSPRATGRRARTTSRSSADHAAVVSTLPTGGRPLGPRRGRLPARRRRRHLRARRRSTTWPDRLPDLQ